MNCIVIGAGNAGRPAARILNHTGNNVVLIDRKIIEEFPVGHQKMLETMEKEGVELRLGSDIPSDFDDLDAAYISPTVPDNAPVRQLLNNKDVEILDNENISQIINNLLDLDVLGITGTLGKTSTTHILSQIFKKAGFKVWTCSSRMGNLLSEVIVDGIVNGLHMKNDVAVIELPHGTSRLMSEVELKVGLITNIYPDHLDEFDYSMEKYVKRKLFITNSSENLISGLQCQDYIETIRSDGIYYCSKHQQKCDVEGLLNEGVLEIRYNIPSKGFRGVFKTPFKLTGYYFENSIAAATAALVYGLDEESIKSGLNSFKGIAGHMEYIGEYNDRKVHFDAAFVPEGLINTLESFEGQKLVVIIDNPDSTNPRDKYKVGEVVGKYADVIICSGYNETTKKYDINAANEVIRGAENSSAAKFPVEDMVIAGELSIKHSHPGYTILHVGPGAITNYDDVKLKMMSGIERGCKKYE